ncbi:hypothetical protein HYW21_05095 [Candidatus Woesearchaeota archaeon]|nr:hypothetical protein [Candidatus Woesearchaeota archaeon]
MKIKPLLPTLRERKRYLVFQIHSSSPLKDVGAIQQALIEALLRYLGEKQLAKAGVSFLDDHYHLGNQEGIIRVNHTSVDEVRAGLCFAQQIGTVPVIFHIKGVSGILAKAQHKYLKTRS